MLLIVLIRLTLIMEIQKSFAFVFPFYCTNNNDNNIIIIYKRIPTHILVIPEKCFLFLFLFFFLFAILTF